MSPLTVGDVVFRYYSETQVHVSTVVAFDGIDATLDPHGLVPGPWSGTWHSGPVRVTMKRHMFKVPLQRVLDGRYTSIADFVIDVRSALRDMYRQHVEEEERQRIEHEARKEALKSFGRSLHPVQDFTRTKFSFVVDSVGSLSVG